MNQFADSGRNFIDPAVHQGCQRRISGHEAAFPGCPGLDSADPAVQHQCQRTALGLGLCGQVPDQLPVGREPLTARSLQPALRRQIRIRDDEPPVHHIVPDRLQQEAFARAVPSHDKAERSPALRDDVHIVQESLDLVFSSNSNIGQADPRDHAALKRIQHRLGDPPRHLFVFFFQNIISTSKNVISFSVSNSS